MLSPFHWFPNWKTYLAMLSNAACIKGFLKSRYGKSPGFHQSEQYCDVIKYTDISL